MSFWCVIGGPTCLYVEEVGSDSPLDDGDVLAVYASRDEADAALVRALAAQDKAQSACRERLEDERQRRAALPVDSAEWHSSLQAEADLRNAMIAAVQGAVRPNGSNC